MFLLTWIEYYKFTGGDYCESQNRTGQPTREGSIFISMCLLTIIAISSVNLCRSSPFDRLRHSSFEEIKDSKVRARRSVLRFRHHVYYAFAQNVLTSEPSAAKYAPALH